MCTTPPPWRLHVIHVARAEVVERCSCPQGSAHRSLPRELEPLSTHRCCSPPRLHSPPPPCPIATAATSNLNLHRPVVLAAAAAAAEEEEDLCTTTTQAAHRPHPPPPPHRASAHPQARIAATPPLALLEEPLVVVEPRSMGLRRCWGAPKLRGCSMRMLWPPWGSLHLHTFTKMGRDQARVESTDGRAGVRWTTRPCCTQTSCPSRKWWSRRGRFT